MESKPGIFNFSFILSFHHFIAEPQRLPFKEFNLKQKNNYYIFQISSVLEL
jgi:hypothetical protein